MVVGTGTGTSTAVLSLVKLPVLNLVPVLTLVRVQVPVLVLFFNINMYGPKNHFWPHMQAGWARAGHTFGLFFWPHVQLKVVVLPKLRYPGSFKPRTGSG